MSSIRFSIIVFIAAILTGCGAGGSANKQAADASDQQSRLAELEEENESLRTQLEEANAKQERKEAIRERVATKARERGLLDEEKDAEASNAKASERRRPRPIRRPAVNPRVCGGMGPGVGYVFANMRAAKKAMPCNGMCYFLTNITESHMSVRVNGRAVTLCNGTEPTIAPPVLRTLASKQEVIENTSMAPPHSVVVLGKFYRSATFDVELHDVIVPGAPFVTLQKDTYSEVFPSGSPNGHAQQIALRQRY